MYERPDNSYIQEPTELKDLVDTTKLVQRFLPKQMDIDKNLEIIKKGPKRYTFTSHHQRNPSYLSPSKKSKLVISQVLIF